MKRICKITFYSFIIVSTLLYSGCALTKPRYLAKSDLQKEYIKGDVAFIQYTFYDSDFDNDSTRNTIFDILTEISYNKQGNITSQKKYSEGGDKLAESDDYIYNKSGKRLINSTHQNLNNMTSIFREYHYKKNKLVEIIDSPGYTSQRFQNGRKGYPLKKMNLFGDSVLMEYTFTYDTLGRLIFENASDSIAVRHHYYDKTDIIKLKEVGDTHTLEYDRDGNWIKSIHWVESILNEQAEYVESTAEYSDYDQYGNWREMRILFDGQVHGKWKRDITYYSQDK